MPCIPVVDVFWVKKLKIQFFAQNVGEGFQCFHSVGLLRFYNLPLVLPPTTMGSHTKWSLPLFVTLLMDPRWSDAGAMRIFHAEGLYGKHPALRRLERARAL